MCHASQRLASTSRPAVWAATPSRHPERMLGVQSPAEALQLIRSTITAVIGSRASNQGAAVPAREHRSTITASSTTPPPASACPYPCARAAQHHHGRLKTTRRHCRGLRLCGNAPQHHHGTIERLLKPRGIPIPFCDVNSQHHHDHGDYTISNPSFGHPVSAVTRHGAITARSCPGWLGSRPSVSAVTCRSNITDRAASSASGRHHSASVATRRSTITASGVAGSARPWLVISAATCRSTIAAALETLRRTLACGYLCGPESQHHHGAQLLTEGGLCGLELQLHRGTTLACLIGTLMLLPLRFGTQHHHGEDTGIDYVVVDDAELLHQATTPPRHHLHRHAGKFVQLSLWSHPTAPSRLDEAPCVTLLVTCLCGHGPQHHHGVLRENGDLDWYELPLHFRTQHHHGAIQPSALDRVVNCLCGSEPQHRHSNAGSDGSTARPDYPCGSKSQHHHGATNRVVAMVTGICLCGFEPQHHHGWDVESGILPPELLPLWSRATAPSRPEAIAGTVYDQAVCICGVEPQHHHGDWVELADYR